MKKVTSLLLLAGVAAFGLVGCGDDEAPPTDPGPDPQITSVSVTPSSISIEPGQTAQVRVDFQTQGDVQGISVAWSSGNTNVATVDPTGDQTATVTGQASGTVSITATVSASNANSQSGSAGVTVEQLENATLSIGAITNQAGTPVNVANVSGQINVEVNVEKADEDVDQVSLLVDGEVVSTQDFATANVESDVSGQQSVEDVVFNFRTDRLEGSSPGNVITAQNVSLDGNVKRGQFDNDEHTISAQLTTAGGAVRSATNSQTLNFNNDNLAIAAHLSGGQGVVEPTSGSRYWGGEDIQVSITPVIFDGGLSAGSVTISANAGSQTASGNGAIVFDSPTVSGEPFVFDILQADNAGGIEDARGSGPDGPGGFGSDFGIGDIRDGSGATVVGQFTLIQMNDFFLDYDAPDQSGSVEFGGVTTTVPGGSVYYSGFQGTGTVPIILPGVSDDGVGGTFSAPSGNFVIDIIDSGTPSTANTLQSDISATWMLPEQAPSGSGGATDQWAHVTDIDDNLNNGVTFSGGGITVTTPVGDFGIDQTAVAESGQLPASATGSSPTGFVFNADGTAAGVLSVDLADPALANGETPSGLNAGSVMVTVEDQSGTVLAGPAAAANPSGTTWTDGGVVAGTADGPQFAFIVHEDNAEPANGDSQAWTYIKDTTIPDWSALNPAPQGSSGFSGSSIIMDVGGNVTDANEIVSATISVFDAVDGTCGNGDDTLLDPAAGEIDRNQIELANGTNSISFNEGFEIFGPPSSSRPTTIRYCFLLTAQDEALDNTGAAKPNTATTRAEAPVTWNN